MFDKMLLYFLIIGIIVLIAAICILYKSKRIVVDNLKEMSKSLSQILDKNTDEKIMIFTDEKSVIELMTQINRMLEDRQKLKVDYRRSELASKRMLSNISHDIKTPLTVILGYLEIMILRAKDEAVMLKKVENKAKQVMELIGKFFTLAKIEAGDTDITISRIQINEICKKNIIDFYDILVDKDFTVEVNIPEVDIYIYGNEDALNRIIFNLISNALRYGKDGKYLGITLRFDNYFAFIDIIDKGQGIEKERVGNVFERLYTTDDSRSNGNGLGLTIAKSLADKINGHIYLESEPNIRTVFTVKLKRMIY